MNTASWASSYPPRSWLIEPELWATVNSTGSVRTSAVMLEKPGWGSGCATYKLRDPGCRNKFCLKKFFFLAYKVGYWAH